MKQRRKKDVLFLVPYPLHVAPSQRFRVEAYFPILEDADIQWDVAPFLDHKAWRVLYQKGVLVQKGWSVVKGFLKRFYTVLFIAPGYDRIFIHREVAPLGPPVFEWMLAKLFRKKIIYDFDDAIWIPNTSEGNRLVTSIKCFWKVGKICRWAHRVSAGNTFLAEWSRKQGGIAIVNPTCVDMVHRYNQVKMHHSGRPVIGWTGSHSTLPYLDLIYPVLQKLEASYDFDFLVICNQPPPFALRSLRFVPWKEATELEDLLQIDIGVMPLLADAWSEGKCGFKLIQYLALGIPAVASPVGVNTDIVHESENGFLADTEPAWEAALLQLLKSAALRSRLGLAGREKMRQQYSLRANKDIFLSLVIDKVPYE